MKRLIVLFLLLPSLAFASVAGMDDFRANISQEDQDKLDIAITSYYLDHDPKKIEAVLDDMSGTNLLRKKTAWAPMIGFLTVVFAHNQQHLFDWMSRNDYNSYAQNVFITALMHANLKETALVFAQAHQWSSYRVDALRKAQAASVDLKHLTVVVPGHIDTLWGAFFGSGDTIYIDEIITACLAQKLPASPYIPKNFSPETLLKADKQRAYETLRQYAPYHKPVREALAARVASEKDPQNLKVLNAILRSAQPNEK